MIPNVTRGGKTAGVLRYLVGKGKREEHEHPHLVAGSPEAVRMAGERELSGADAGELARFLDEPRERFGTRVTVAERNKEGRVVGTRDAHVWHCSLALHPDEPDLSDERWGEICEQFIEEMEFAGERAAGQCRWVAIRHGRSTGGSDHAHLVVTLVAEDGSKGRVHNDRPRAQKACRELEQRFGLRGLEARTRGGGSRALKHGEIAADRRRGRGVGERGEHAERSSRHRLERVVRACAGAARNETEFVRRLREHGLQARRGTRRAARARWSATRSGSSVARHDRGRAAWYGGGRLARDLTLPALRRSWRQQPGEERPRSTSGSQDEPASGARRPSGAPSSRSAGCYGIAARRRSSGCGCSCAQRAATRRRARTRRARAPRCSRRGRRPGGRAAGAAGACEPAAGAVGGAARLHAGAAAHTVPGVGAGAVHARRRASGQRGRLAAGLPRAGLLAGEIGRVHRARGELDRALEIETHLHGELEQIRARIDADRPDPAMVELDAETEAARRAREPFGPATRETPKRPPMSMTSRRSSG